MNKAEVKEILRVYQLDKAKKSLGQNFLLNEEVLQNIIKYSDLSEKDTVIEIGPGLGFLSQLLVSRVGKLYLVELDDKLIVFLKNQFFNFDNIEFVHNNILKIHFEDLIANDNYKIVANIPYNITSNLFRKIMLVENKPELLTLLIQKEVAQRISATAGQMSVLAVLLQVFYKIELKEIVKNTNFYPAPKVDSAVVKLTRIFKIEKELNNLQISFKQFSQIVKIGFSAKRKKLLNNLANGLAVDKSELKMLFQDLGWSEKTRAQELSVSDWLNLAVALSGAL